MRGRIDVRDICTTLWTAVPEIHLAGSAEGTKRAWPKLCHTGVAGSNVPVKSTNVLFEMIRQTSFNDSVEEATARGSGVCGVTQLKGPQQQDATIPINDIPFTTRIIETVF
jgi:hypothetical protein